ncbi:MAG: hypothetical protein ACI4IJ_06345 [Acutalibacteraceae bacterium]
MSKPKSEKKFYKPKNKIYTKQQKIVRNFVFSLIFIVSSLVITYCLAWVSNDFPLPTKKMAMHRCEDANFAERSEIVEVCRNDRLNYITGNHVSIIGLTPKYIHLTVARHVGVGAVQFMYRPVSFMNIPRSADGLDFVPLPVYASGESTYNDVYNPDGYNPMEYTKEAMGDDYYDLNSGIGVIICNNEDIDYMDIDLYYNEDSPYQMSECKYSHIEKNESGVYPLRYLTDVSFIGFNLVECDLGQLYFNMAPNYRSNYEGYLQSKFDNPPQVAVRGYDKSGKLVIEKVFDE